MVRCITPGSIAQITSCGGVKAGVRCNWQSNCIRYEVAYHCLCLFYGLLSHQNKECGKLQNVMSLQCYVSSSAYPQGAFHGQTCLKHLSIIGITKFCLHTTVAQVALSPNGDWYHFNSVVGQGSQNLKHSRDFVPLESIHSTPYLLPTNHKL
jgi:hypothetical protein